jgi:formamidopyrimidine-DNA glycosylase
LEDVSEQARKNANTHAKCFLHHNDSNYDRQNPSAWFYGRYGERCSLVES